MARVPEAELARIKREVSVERLAEAKGVKLKRHGADLIGLCPFHDDKEPSLVISPKKNLWHCLGACQAGGSVIDWVMRDRGVSFRHAVELLREDLPASAVVEASGAEPVLPSPVEPEAGDSELLVQVVGYYHETLKESPKVLEYLESRGLNHPEAIDRFQLGFANRTLGYRLAPKQVKAGREIRGRLQRLGVLRNSGHEHFNGSLVVPVFDARAQVVEIYGRKITRGLRKGTPLHLYLPGPHRGVFNLPALADRQELILCESLLDALAFWCAGYRHVTSAYGVGGFTEEMLEAFQAYGTERVLIAYDRDEAGEAAAGKVAERLNRAGIDAYRVLFPRGMDANEYSLKVTPAAKSLGVVLRKAVWLGQGEPPEDEPGGEPVAATEARVPAAEKRAAKEKEGEASTLLSPLAAGRAGEPEGEPEEPAPAASPVPAAPKLEVPAEVSEREVVIALGDRRYRVRGLGRNLAYDVMKVNLLAGRGEGFHVDTLDLYSARHRTVFQKAAAGELGVEAETVKKDLGRVLFKLEQLQEEQIRAALEPKSEAVEISDGERRRAVELLGDSRLLERILEDLEACGVVGEETNKLMGYLAATSRLLQRPLAVVVQSTSAAGKSALMEAVLALVPPEHQVKYSAMTGQSLFYMGEQDLKHKVLAIVEEEGAERASYALKLLQSEGELTIASTGKDPSTGKLTTHEYRVEGPVMIFLTTTAIDVDEELLNRCLVLSVDEAREQTRAIHRLQRERRTLSGLVASRRRETLVELHRNAQRLLRPLSVVNPFAPELTFLDTQIRTRRDHEKYLTLIDSIALLHQYQREVQRTEVDGRPVDYIEVEPSDIETANRLAHEVLGRSLDELPPQTRRLLGFLDRLVAEECERLSMARSDYRFTRRQVREACRWGDTQLRLHLARLVSLEYLLVHQGGRGQSYVYELVYESMGEDSRPFLPGLIDVEALRGQGTTQTPRGREATSRGQTPDPAPPSRPHRGGVAGGSRDKRSPVKSEAYRPNGADSPKTAHLEPGGEAASCRTSASPAEPLSPFAARVGGGS